MDFSPAISGNRHFEATATRNVGGETSGASRLVVQMWSALFVAVLMAATLTVGVPQSAQAAARPDVLFVVDTSGSMGGTPMAQAKAALNTAIDALDEDQPAGLRSYAGGCGDGGILRVPIGTENRDQLRTETDRLSAGGGTPTPDALRAGALDFSDGAPGTVVLISDGQSTCGDPCPVAAALADELGVQFKVHAVGFRAPDAAAQELACIAEATGGNYYSADDENGLRDAIGDAIGGAPRLRMVALGDSYSSGEGTNNYDAHREAQRCHRGPDAWPRILEQNVWDVVEIEHKACTGARTGQLFSDYLGNPYQIPPLSDEDATPDPNVDFVTITIGGNDVGFSKILEDCWVPRRTCAGYPYSTPFERKLDNLYRKLVNEVHPAIVRAYPNAYIVHVGYPRLLPSPGEPTTSCGWLGSDEQQAAADLLYQLNGTIYLATEANPRINWVDVTDALDGHELCTPDSWMVPIGPGRASERGHPNAAGQEAYARAVVDALGFQWALTY